MVSVYLSMFSFQVSRNEGSVYRGPVRLSVCRGPETQNRQGLKKCPLELEGPKTI
jgi:hypothetical protein